MPDSGDAVTPGRLSSAGQPAGGRPRSRRWLALTALAVVVVVGLIAWALYYALVGSRQVATDNAYVGAEVAQVTPLISGQVTAVPVAETQTVRAGQPVVVLDPSDQRIALAQAKAALSQAERQVRGYFANDAALGAQVASRNAAIAQAEAQIAGARSDLTRASTDLTRRQALSASGAVSGEELTTAQNRFATAQAALRAAEAARSEAVANAGQAQGARAVNRTLISGANIAENPDVLAARARVDAAQLALSRTVIAAPVDGVIAKKSVEVGQQVQPGAVTMQIVPTRSMFVDANFKEVQLARVRPGEPARLTSDLYGSKVVFHGWVRGLSGGTGSAFSLIPAQNASGNWIKIVQRLPVRIALDPKELEQHPLRVGLSMHVGIALDAAPRDEPRPGL